MQTVQERAKDLQSLEQKLDATSMQGSLREVYLKQVRENLEMVNKSCEYIKQCQQ